MAAGSLLCLKCRKSGHFASECASSDWPQDPFTWFFCDERKSMSFGVSPNIVENELCRRCQDLDILELLSKDLEWDTTSALNRLSSQGADKFKSIGKTGSIEFWNDCPLCVCFFALTPNRASLTQDVLFLADWTMNRVAGETDTVTDLEGWHQFAKCLLVTLTDIGSSSLGFSTKLHRGDGLALVQDDTAKSCLGARIISPDNLNVNIIEDWLSSCLQLHQTRCRSEWTSELRDIRLVDVSTRMIVRPPENAFEYLALSYVWGDIPQQVYHLGDRLETLPQTMEDAIEFTRRLKKRYLWVDSLCIDQTNPEEKKRQISKMHNIYGGAILTLIALSGRSANAGLPRFGKNQSVYSQLSCRINGKLLAGLMPTLSQQIWRAPWGKRAWTLQEGLLSPRCLYISDHQLYFECNGMQCCESLDETKSWAHHFKLQSVPDHGGWLASKVGDGCLRVPIDNPSHRMERYGSKLTLYSYRAMTHSTDGLNAFAGILSFLQTMYQDGFFQGLPLEDFHWALLWRAQWTPTRRSGFPSWSWAGWEGGLFPAYPRDFTKPHQYPLHIRIWRVVDNTLIQIFQTTQTNLFANDPANNAALLNAKGPLFDPISYPNAENDNYLFIETLTLQFAIPYKRSLRREAPGGESIFLHFLVRDVHCYMITTKNDPELDQPAFHEKKRFLLLARDRGRDVVMHHLLLVRLEWDVAVRGTVTQLVVPEDRLDVLEDLELEKRRVVLA